MKLALCLILISTIVTNIIALCTIERPLFLRKIVPFNELILPICQTDIFINTFAK